MIGHHALPEGQELTKQFINSVQPDQAPSEIPVIKGQPFLSYPTVGWSVIIIGLLGLFVMQFAYFKRDELARHIILRPALEQLCALAACTLPLQRDLSKIIILNRDIRSAPDNDKVLHVKITLQNIAPHTQPYPQIQLTFSDINGNLTARRRFLPKEYLSKDTNINKGLTSLQSVIAHLEIIDPGTRAMAFKFDFY